MGSPRRQDIAAGCRLACPAHRRQAEAGGDLISCQVSGEAIVVEGELRGTLPVDRRWERWEESCKGRQHSLPSAPQPNPTTAPRAAVPMRAPRGLAPPSTRSDALPTPQLLTAAAARANTAHNAPIRLMARIPAGDTQRLGDRRRTWLRREAVSQTSLFQPGGFVGRNVSCVQNEGLPIPLGIVFAAFTRAAISEEQETTNKGYQPPVLPQRYGARPLPYARGWKADSLG